MARWVIRSTPLLADETKPNSVRIAPRIQAARLNVASDSRIAPRPSVLRIARVLLPFFSASLAIRAMSRGPSASLSPSSAACVPALVCTRPTSLASFIRPSAFSAFTTVRASRSAVVGLAIAAPARLSADQSTTSRSERPIQSDMRALRRPVLRAAFTAERPMRAGPPRRPRHRCRP